MAKPRMTRVVGIVFALLLGACGSMAGGPFGNTSSPPPQVSRSGSGVVESIDVVRGNDPGLVGALVGAVAGGVLGNQIGAGRGRIVATVAGTVGGAIAGREVERRIATKDQVHKIAVRMYNGERQTIAMDTDADFRVGDRVHIQDGHIYRDR